MKKAMKYIGIIAFAVMGLSFFSSCEVDPENQTVVTITNISSKYAGGYATLAFFKNIDDKEMKALSLPRKINLDRKVECEMVDPDNMKMVSVDGNYFLFLMITETSDGKGDLYSGFSGQKRVAKGPTSISFSQFYTKDDTGENVSFLKSMLSNF